MELSLVLDIFIVIMIILGAIQGFKNGAIKTSMRFVGLFLVIIVSFILKDRLMIIMYENLPFFDFFGLIEGVDSINILLYQLISFVVVFSCLMLVLKVLVVITGMVEWLLKKMVFIGIPSKILGSLIGGVEYYVYVFIILYILNVPIFGLNFIEKSNLGGFILNKTPVLSDMVDGTVRVYSDVWNVIRNRGDLSGQEINTFVLATLLDNKLITIDSARKLVKSNYITIKDVTILDKYDDNYSFFEEIGGCVLVGGCGMESNVISEISKTYIYDDKGSYVIGDIEFSVSNISFNNCISTGKCMSDERIEVSLVVNNGLDNVNINVVTGDRYKWIINTDNYISASIDNGKLAIIVYEYRGGGNKYDN